MTPPLANELLRWIARGQGETLTIERTVLDGPGYATLHAHSPRAHRWIAIDEAAYRRLRSLLVVEME